MTARLLVIVGLLCTSATAWAHKPSDAQIRLNASGTTVSGSIEISVRDLDNAIALDANGNGEITWGELSQSAPRITSYVEQRLAFATAGTRCETGFGTGALVDLSDGPYWTMPITSKCASEPTKLEIAYSLLFDVDAQHRGLINLGGEPVIIPDSTPVTVELGTGSTVVDFIGQGIWHIWIGFDHILFLICLILPAVYPLRDGTWQPATSLKEVALEVLEIVTAFTLAHSITLVISAVGLVTLPTRIVETAIALSVLAAAVNNLFRAIDARWAVAFSLGLLHGFGFSAALVDLGLPSGRLVGVLLGFNIGVEIGQAAIVVVTLPLLYLVRRTIIYQGLLWIGSSLVAALAAMWAYERWFGG